MTAGSVWTVPAGPTSFALCEWLASEMQYPVELPNSFRLVLRPESYPFSAALVAPDESMPMYVLWSE